MRGEDPLSFVSSMRAAAKQAQDEESLMCFLAKKYVIKSMRPDGDCGYELMCKWKEIHAARKRGNSLSKKIIDEPIYSGSLLLNKKLRRSKEDNILKQEKKLLKPQRKENQQVLHKH